MGLRNEVEEVVGVRQRTWAAALEGDPSLGVEADARYGSAHGLSRAIYPSHARSRVLARQEQGTVALTAAHLEDALGGAGHLENRSGECDKSVGWHEPIIAS